MRKFSPKYALARVGGRGGMGWTAHMPTCIRSILFFLSFFLIPVPVPQGCGQAPLRPPSPPGLRITYTYTLARSLVRYTALQVTGIDCLFSLKMTKGVICKSRQRFSETV